MSPPDAAEDFPNHSKLPSLEEFQLPSMKRKKTDTLRKIGNILEAIPVIVLGTIFSRLPKKMAPPLALIGGALLFRLDRRDRKRAYRNLDIILDGPRIPLLEKDRILKALFINIVTGALEYLRLDRITRRNFRDFVQIDNYEAIDSALEKGKGVLAISAHVGNWEYLGTVSAKLGYPLSVVLKRQHNPYTDRWLRNIREQQGGFKCLYHGKGLGQRISAHIKQNGILAILADQRDVAGSLMAPFFGIPSSTSDGPARLHLWYESPIVFAFSIKQPNGKYLLQFEGPYHFAGSGDHRKDCIHIMTFINQKYENVIRKYPDQWLSLLTPRWETP